MSNPLRALQEYGQSVWLDFVSRELLKSGEIGTPRYFESAFSMQARPGGIRCFVVRLKEA